MKKQQHYKAALYCRLSVDDGNFGGSVSIETQKILLEQYCKDHKITDYKFYCDDGCSGTNFDRPSFKKMLSDIDEGKINLVIVKDLSRFGRNYVEAGMYVQRFTDSNIRFIAADDNYDSLVNSDDLLFPIKNVVNEMYARDVSKKTKAAKKWFCQYHLTHFIRTRIMQRERYDHSRAFFGLPEAAHRWRCRFFC